MAISNIIPRKIMRNRTRQQSMADRHDYDQKAEKTQDGELVSSFMCSPETAAEEFEISKQLYYQITGRSQPKGRDVLMYRIIQSFKPGEVSPEEANRIGYELAMKFTGGQHQFVVATHVDKAHIHTHIEFNSTNLNCDGKFRDMKQSAMVLRRLNDELCRAHGLSVIENPKPSAKKQKELAAAKYGTSHKERLRQTIDRLLPDCRDYDDFLARMRAEGYEIKEGKTLSFRAPGWDRFARSNRLGADYTREALRERSAHRGGRSAAAKKPVPHAGRKVNMLIDIQAKLAAGKGAGYERWAKIFNLKEAAKTLNFLIENDLTDYDELAARAEQAGDRFDEVSRRIKQLEGRMADVAQLKTHIINYSKTREVYAAYKKSRHKKEFLADHGTEIAQHEAAKKAFDALGGKPIPKVAQLSEQYAALLAEKQEQYAEYKALRQDMIAYRTAKQNVDKILGLVPENQAQNRDQKPER
nr:relaxase/mobilization nuclease domain-containing protein [uncultured Oscillibacter sp.]